MTSLPEPFVSLFVNGVDPGAPRRKAEWPSGGQLAPAQARAQRARNGREQRSS